MGNDDLDWKAINTIRLLAVCSDLDLWRRPKTDLIRSMPRSKPTVATLVRPWVRCHDVKLARDGTDDTDLQAWPQWLTFYGTNS
jgi:hypothetical protein